MAVVFSILPSFPPPHGAPLLRLRPQFKAERILVSTGDTDFLPKRIRCTLPAAMIDSGDDRQPQAHTGSYSGGPGHPVQSHHRSWDSSHAYRQPRAYLIPRCRRFQKINGDRVPLTHLFSNIQRFFPFLFVFFIHLS